MIDEMIKILGSEQQDDDHKKEYCSKQFDFADDKKKGLEHDISNLEKAIADEQDSIAMLTHEVDSLVDGVKALDKAVAEATEQRREEHKDYTELIASNSAAKEVLGFAKNRLNKFYNPKLYLPPPKREFSEEQRITLNLGGALAPTNAPGGIAGTGIAVLSQVSAHTHRKEAPPPPSRDLRRLLEEVWACNRCDRHDRPTHQKSRQGDNRGRNRGEGRAGRL